MAPLIASGPAGSATPALARVLTAAIRTGIVLPTPRCEHSSVTAGPLPSARRAAACSRPRRQKGASVAKLAAISPTTHHLFFSQTSQFPASAASPFAAGWGAQGRGLPADRDPGPARRLGHDLLRPLPPAVAVQHAQFLIGKAPFAAFR